MWQSVSVGVLFYVMSLSIGKAGLPFADGLVGEIQLLRRFLLGHAPGPAQHGKILTRFSGIHTSASFLIPVSHTCLGRVHPCFEEPVYAPQISKTFRSTRPGSEKEPPDGAIRGLF